MQQDAQVRSHENKATSSKYWQLRVEFFLEGGEALKQDITRKLSNHKDIWSGRYGSIMATTYTIDLKEGTRPIRQQPYRTGLTSCGIIHKQIGRQLVAGGWCNHASSIIVG